MVREPTEADIAAGDDTREKIADKLAQTVHKNDCMEHSQAGKIPQGGTCDVEMETKSRFHANKRECLCEINQSIFL